MKTVEGNWGSKFLAAASFPMFQRSLVIQRRLFVGDTTHHSTVNYIYPSKSFL